MANNSKPNSENNPQGDAQRTNILLLLAGTVCVVVGLVNALVGITYYLRGESQTLTKTVESGYLWWKTAAQVPTVPGSPDYWALMGYGSLLVVGGWVMLTFCHHFPKLAQGQLSFIPVSQASKEAPAMDRYGRPVYESQNVDNTVPAREQVHA